MEDTLATATDTTLKPAERCDAIDDLATDGEPAVAPLHALAEDPNHRVAKCARKALAEVDDPEAAHALVLVLRDSDPGVVASAAEALGRIGDPIAVRPLARLLVSPNPTVVTTALQALERIGEPAAHALVSALRDSDPGVVASAAEALGRIGDPIAVRPLARLLVSPNLNVVTTALQALGRIGDARAEATLVSVLGTDPANSRSAGVALARIHRDDVTPLVPLLDDPRNIALAYALVDVGQKGTEDALVTALIMYGDVGLAEYYLNCGNGKLEKAASTWAGEHGYDVITTPGFGGDQWGSGV